MRQPKRTKNQLNIAEKLLMMQEAQIRESAERVKEKPASYGESPQVATSDK